jgi:hypothetical protein
VHYYEHVAESKGDEDREEVIVSAATELKKTLNILTSKVEGEICISLALKAYAEFFCQKSIVRLKPFRLM